MHVLFVSGEYGDVAAGGIGSYVATMARALTGLGHEVSVLSCLPDQVSSDDVEPSGVRVHRRPAARLRGLGRVVGVNAGLRGRAVLGVARHARRLGLRPDVVEVPDWMAEGLLLPREWPRVAQLHTPVSVIESENGRRADGLGSRLADRLERASVSRADVVTAPSAALAQRLRADGWLKADPVIQPLPVALERWTPQPPATADRPVVLVVGRLEPRKGHLLVVEALARLRSSGVEAAAHLLGNDTELPAGGSCAEDLRRRAESLGVDLRIEPATDADGVRRAVADATVVAVPSVFESFSMVAAEALASARPVVCAPRVGAGELLAGTDAGAVADERTPEAFAAALRPFLVDGDAAIAAGQAARALAERVLDPRTLAQQRLALYRAARERRGLS